MEKLTAVPIVWPYPCLEVSVLCSFDDFLHHEMTGIEEKATVLWLPAGTFVYRFMVDGSYVCDPMKPIVEVEEVCYNEVVVEDVPDALAKLSSLSLAEIEVLDRELFSHPTRKSSHTSSFVSIDSDLPVIDRIPQLPLPANFGLNQRYTEIRAANTIKAWFIRLKVTLIQFLRLKKSVVFLQAHIRRWLCQLQFRPVKLCFAAIKARQCSTVQDSRCSQTDINSRLMNEIIASWGRLTAENKRLTDEHTSLLAELSLQKGAVRTVNISISSDSDLSLGRLKLASRSRK